MGQIDGACVLYVQSDNYQTQTSFKSFYQKFSQHLPNSQLEPTFALTSDDLSLDVQDTPKNRQVMREHQILIDAQKQLLNSPVLQQLWQSGYIDERTGGAIFHSKLTINLGVGD